MYKLLIVDDEEMIVDWLVDLFRKIDHLELDIYRAYSGDEAVDWLNRIKIDVILTDIRMPGMDGMELLQRVRDNWPECRMIFLTGYDEFNYVYTAIQHEGVGYLLKTEDDEAIIEAVENIIAEIEKSVQAEKLIKEAQKQFHIALPLLQKEYLMDLLQGEVSSAEIRVQQFKEMDIPLHGEKPVLLLVGRMDDVPKSITVTEKSRVLYGIKILSEQYLMPSVSCVHIMIDNTLLLWFIQPKGINDGLLEEDESWEKTFQIIKGSLEYIQSASKRLLYTSLSLVLDSELVIWENVNERFDELKLLLNCRIGLGVEMVLMDKSLSFHESNFSEHYNQTVQKARTHLKRLGKLENYLDRGQKVEYFQLLSILIECLKEVTSINNNPALEIYYSISLTLLSYINRWNLTEKLAFHSGLYKLTRVDEHGSWSEAIIYLYRLSEILFELQIEDQENRSTKAIAHIKQHIQDNIEKDLSIVSLSELVHFNPSYLSRLFKQVTGINLSDFISEAKLNKARDLLEKTNLKVHEIAASVGYESPSYFNRFFKKAIGMTPQEYRLAILNK